MVRNSDDVGAIICYVLENPIRAAIVDEVGKYPFWGFVHPFARGFAGEHR